MKRVAAALVVLLVATAGWLAWRWFSRQPDELPAEWSIDDPALVGRAVRSDRCPANRLLDYGLFEKFGVHATPNNTRNAGVPGALPKPGPPSSDSSSWSSAV